MNYYRFLVEGEALEPGDQEYKSNDKRWVVIREYELEYHKTYKPRLFGPVRRRIPSVAEEATALAKKILEEMRIRKIDSAAMGREVVLWDNIESIAEYYGIKLNAE